MSIIKRLFGAKEPTRPERTSPLLPPAPLARVYVVGDIHGELGLLNTLLEKIDADRGDADATTVFVGDYVDRGPESAGVLTMLRDRQERDPDKTICLLGNHEKMMLDFIDRPEERASRWLRNGGLQTLASFGLSGVTETTSGTGAASAAADLRASLPEGLENWLRNLPLRWSSGSLWVVHAAVAPDEMPPDSDERTLIWGHRDFLKFPRQDDLWIAHGHTVTYEPVASDNRVPVDTGAFHTGILTAAAIETDGTVRFLQVTH